MNTPDFSLRKHIRGILKELFEGTGFFIKFNSKKNEFELYKKYKGEDADFNIIDKIDLIKRLGPDPKEAQRLAKEITSQDLTAKLPDAPKKIDRGNTILPFETLKGKRIADTPIPVLINYMLRNNKWMSRVRKNDYKTVLYEYLTQDVLSQTQEYLAKIIKGMNTQKLIEKYNEYWQKEKPHGDEVMVFERVMIPLMKEELTNRAIQFVNGFAILPGV